MGGAPGKTVGKLVWVATRGQQVAVHGEGQSVWAERPGWVTRRPAEQLQVVILCVHTRSGGGAAVGAAVGGRCPPRGLMGQGGLETWREGGQDETPMGSCCGEVWALVGGGAGRRQEGRA